MVKDVKTQLTKEVVKLAADEHEGKSRELDLCFQVEQIDGQDLLSDMQEAMNGIWGVEVTVVSAIRLSGKAAFEQEGPGKPRPVIAKFKSVEDKVKVLRNGYKLKKQALPVRMQTELTKMQQQHRNACWGEFSRAKEGQQEELMEE